MRKVLVYSLIILVFASCQKDTDFGDLVLTNTGGNTNGDLLLKVVSVNGTDTSITEYGYDGSNRLLSKKDYGKESGSPFSTYAKYYRDSEGRIVKIATKDASLPDTLFSVLHYPASGTFNFDYKVVKVASGGLTVTDSAVYTYANNLPAKEDHYQSVISGISTLALRLEYVHNTSGDMQSAKYYEIKQGAAVLTGELKFGYDDKTNPANFGNDAFAVNGVISKHNIIKQEIIDINPPGTITVNIQYTYNSKGYPITASATDPSGGTGKVSFYYK